MFNISSLCPQGVDFRFVASHDEEEVISWIGIEEMPAEPIDFNFEDRLLAEIDADRHFVPGPLDYELFEEDEDDFDDWWDDGYYSRPPSEEELEQLAAEEAAEFLELELEAADRFQPRFGSGYSKRKVRSFNEDAKLDSKRSKAHTTDRGWRRYAPKKLHGRDSIRTLSVDIVPRHSVSDYLDGFQTVH